MFSIFGNSHGKAIDIHEFFSSGFFCVENLSIVPFTSSICHQVSLSFLIFHKEMSTFTSQLHILLFYLQENVLMKCLLSFVFNSFHGTFYWENVC